VAGFAFAAMVHVSSLAEGIMRFKDVPGVNFDKKGAVPFYIN